MAWDSKTARRRGNSVVNKLNSHLSTAIPQIEPKSTHCADAALQPFLSASFDPAEYLNSTLPSLSISEPKRNALEADVSLAELSTQTQTLLSQLSAHTTRLTNTLTTLTDEILRSGSRLAYEVEVLRGETLGLSEVLTEGLHDEIVNFVPGGLEEQLTKQRTKSSSDITRRRSSLGTGLKQPLAEEAPVAKDPEYVTKLRTLTAVRTRLDTVIKTFGDAMAWTFPPSEVSVTSSFVSVSAPEPGSEAFSIEAKGQQVSKQLRDEIADLLLGAEPVAAIEAAAKRVEELKQLAQIWKGTAEEKARVRFVEGLAKLVEDRHRDLLREAESSNGRSDVHQVEASKIASSIDPKANNGFGFMSQLQKMRGGL